MEELIGLELIDANPWQPREREDAEHVEKIAASIEAEGLMQVPVGRRVDGRVQLAFGHTRLAAFKLIASRRMDNGYQHMPVQIRELNDEEMFRYGIGENLARKDLTAIEEAKAMRRYQEEFGKTSVEIGDLFGKNEATVRGTIRMLKLPAHVLKQMEEGAPLTQVAARELLVLFDLPEELRDRAEKDYYAEDRPSKIVTDALAGMNGDNIRQRVTRMVGRYSLDMSDAPWKHDQAYDYEGVVSPTCKGCSQRILREKTQICLNKSCFEARGKAVQLAYLRAASAICGLQVLEDKDRYSTHELSTWRSDVEQTKAILATGCQNLGLVWTNYKKREGEEDPTRPVAEYPQALIVCSRRQGQCTCHKALGHQVELVARATQMAGDGQAAEAGKAMSAAPQPPTAEDLKELERLVRRQKKQNVQEVKAMQAEVTSQIAMALAGGNPGAWARLVHKLTYKDVKGQNVIDLRLAVAEVLTDDIFNLQYHNDPSPKSVLMSYNQVLKEMGLLELKSGIEEPGSVSAETVEEPAGETLVEVFAGPEDDQVEDAGMVCGGCGAPMRFDRWEEDSWGWWQCTSCGEWKGVAKETAE